MEITVCDKEIESAFIKLKENDFSKSIVIPLLEKIYKARVEFVGGVAEKGRDILIHAEDHLGFPETIGIQVKKIKPKINSSTDSFQQLLNQISQMKAEGVIDRPTGNKIPVKKVIFLTPYLIEEHILNSHEGAFSLLKNQHNSEIIDGYMLIRLIKRHYPELLYTIFENQVVVKNELIPKLSNNELMRALNFSSVKNLCDIYCDISFSIGTETYSEYFKCKVLSKNITEQLSINYKHINTLTEAQHFIKKYLNVEFYDEKTLLLEKTNANKIKELQKKLQLESESSASLKEQVRSNQNYGKYSSLFPKTFETKVLQAHYDAMKPELISTENFELLKEIKDSIVLLKKRDEHIKTVRVLAQKIDSSDFSILVNTSEAAKHFEMFKADLITLSKNIEFNLLEYLKLTQAATKVARLFKKLKKHFILSPNVLDSLDSAKNLQLPIEKVFNTGLNIAVLGNAGSGKTTNLQVHAQRLFSGKSNSLVIYATLSELAQLSTIEDQQDLLIGLHKYLLKLGVNVNFTDICECLTNERAILILDSIDEAIASYPWVIGALSDLNSKLRLCQIITSSRYSVHSVHDLGFVNISLLPFNKEQKAKFFFKWFIDDKKKAEEIIFHLEENKELNDVVTNPLSSTILATLCENNISLPTTESSLYEKRFELLSGMFDRFKNIQRMTNAPDELIKLAKYLAFEMHNKEKRSFTLMAAKDICRKSNFGYSHNKIDSLVDELVTPAEIIALKSDGKYDFGHLRFQEYLASKEINSRKSFNFSKVITNKWWEDVFILYSQHAPDVEWIITQATSDGYSTTIRDLLISISNNQPEAIRNKLIKRIEIAKSVEMDYSDDVDFEEKYYDENFDDLKFSGY